ncbi:hypothetical protein [Chamaesiphon polymorphus]|uniref:Uncharacterized protein n=1 Tax=Chamaesiphon polymorphus CCALA 037 TaxID=2107692 RepID=A0A2T1GME1_9CYAN|nr:hypothetical protein [Chamaesiphon polymorphus]PSB59036.1 hypothetical protein C7B77_02460 [Chamaesiphon polymorphus CCALA 037]
MALVLNETLLYAAKHQPSIVDDADLFCSVYGRVPNLGSKDVIFLGASRMQTGIDLTTFTQQYPDRQALILAQSGLGTSYPVFKDIVENTNYKGTVVIDETEATLAFQDKGQATSVKHCHHNFSMNRQLNRSMSSWLQSTFVFLNPQSSSFRLWGNLIAERKLPVPFYTKTLNDRQQLTDYARAQPQALKALAESRIPKNLTESNRLPTFDTWFATTQHWQQPIAKFQRRGGKVIFVRLPVSEELWQFERKIYPQERYWQPGMKQLNVKSIHFADYPELSTFKLPDTSHLDLHDKATFTQRLLARLSNSLDLPIENN